MGCDDNQLKTETYPLVESVRPLIQAGFAVHRVKPRGKAPIGNGWESAPVHTYDSLRAEYQPGDNLGVRLGEPSKTDGGYLHIVDLDIRDAAQADEARGELAELLPLDRVCATVESGSGGHSRHFYILLDEPLPGRKLAKSPGSTMVFDAKLGRDVKKHDWEIELLGTGKQAVLPGSIHQSGGRYRWERDPCPIVDFALTQTVPVDRFKREAPTDLDPAEPGNADIAQIRSALATIDADDRDDWIKVGMALHHETGASDEGLAEWDTWSQTSEKWRKGETARKWKGFAKPRNGQAVGIGTLFHLARAAGWEDPRLSFDVDAWLRDLEDLPLQPDAPKPGKAKRSTLTFLTPNECVAAPSRGYIIKGILAPRDVGCIFGAPGAGKSLLAPHLGYAVARGEAAFGMRTKPGGVLYVAAEDAHGMRGRVRALCQRHGDAPGFYVVEGVSDIASPGARDLDALVAEVEARKPVLIFIDTLAMAAPGADENTSEAMGRVVAAARRLTQWGAAVVLIHHDTKAEGGTPRGHSLLNGALDMALHVKRDESGVIRGKLTKNRNGSCERDIAFTIGTEDGGTDEDGDEISLPLVAEFSPEFDFDLSPKERAVLRVLREALARREDFPDVLPDGEIDPFASSLREAELREACRGDKGLCKSDLANSQNKAFREALSGLKSKGAVLAVPGKVPDEDRIKLNDTSGVAS